MIKKIVLTLTLMVFVASIAFAEKPEVEYHSLFYIYSFSWQNADFDSDTDDNDQHYYLHGDFSIDADYGNGVGSKLTLGAWGTFGRHAITASGPETGVALREAYLHINDFFDTPFSMKLGKQHVCYGDQVFDGGEDGFMGATLTYGSDMFDMDLMSLRLEEGGGTNYIGSITDSVPHDWDLYGAWGNIKMDNININPYGFMRTRGDAKPMWLGLRSDGSPMNGLNYSAEFTMMMGEDAAGTKYAGNHYMGRLDYNFPDMPLSLGGGYVNLSGDDPSTDDNELYESPCWGPYTFGFYKGWPGFGPAHLLRSAYGFSLTAPWAGMVTNTNIMNGHIGYSAGKLDMRADFFKYAKNEVGSGMDENMGTEMALMLKYHYKDTITFGATGGYWTPGDYFSGDDPMLGGYIWTAIGF